MTSYIIQLKKHFHWLFGYMRSISHNQSYRVCIVQLSIVQPQRAVQLSPWFSLLPVWKDDFLCKDVLCADLKEVFHTHMHVAHSESVARPD